MNKQEVIINKIMPSLKDCYYFLEQHNHSELRGQVDHFLQENSYKRNVIHAYNRALMARCIEEGDRLIISNRKEAHVWYLCAIFIDRYQNSQTIMQEFSHFCLGVPHALYTIQQKCVLTKFCICWKEMPFKKDYEKECWYYGMLPQSELRLLKNALYGVQDNDLLKFSLLTIGEVNNTDVQVILHNISSYAPYMQRQICKYCGLDCNSELISMQGRKPTSFRYSKYLNMQTVQQLFDKIGDASLTDFNKMLDANLWFSLPTLAYRQSLWSIHQQYIQNKSAYLATNTEDITVLYAYIANLPRQWCSEENAIITDFSSIYFQTTSQELSQRTNSKYANNNACWLAAVQVYNQQHNIDKILQYTNYLDADLISRCNVDQQLEKIVKQDYQTSHNLDVLVRRGTGRTFSNDNGFMEYIISEIHRDYNASNNLEKLKNRILAMSLTNSQCNREIEFIKKEASKRFWQSFSTTDLECYYCDKDLTIGDLSVLFSKLSPLSDVNANRTLIKMAGELYYTAAISYAHGITYAYDKNSLLNETIPSHSDEQKQQLVLKNLQEDMIALLQPVQTRDSDLSYKYCVKGAILGNAKCITELNLVQQRSEQFGLSLPTISEILS